MNANKKIVISTAGSRKATLWKKEVLTWFEFAERLKNPFRSSETLEEYMNLPKGEQDDLKDVGGFVGGELKEGRRKNGNILSRDLVTLDLDNIEAGKTEEILKKMNSLGITYVIYSTRKHAEYKPRLRIIIPTNRSMTVDEYEPVARKIADIIGIHLCDSTTFEIARLMFYPSCSSNSTYVYIHELDKPFADVDGLLAMYEDWRNISEWPQVPGTEKSHLTSLKKQGNPLEKGGVIGAFCNIFNIYDAIEKFIPGEYEACNMPDRLTYTGGSTFGGAIVYEDGNFIFSHHATDPAGGKLCNSFDLIRLHLFGDLDVDAKASTPVNKLPSFVEVSKLARSIEAVSNILNKEKYLKSTAYDDFTPIDHTEPEAVTDEIDLSWMDKFVRNNNGEPEKIIFNIALVLENDPRLKGKLALDEFANRGVVLGALPWNSETKMREWQEVDDSFLRSYLEHVYGLSGEKKVSDALLMVTSTNKVNAVRDYLQSLKWDGVKRLDTLLIDYFGVEDNIYTRQVMRVALTAAVARAMKAGTKFDYTVVLTGKQGTGKTSFFTMLGKDWFNNSLNKYEGKDAAEVIQGAWIVELGELANMGKSEVDAVKHFLTKQEDIYREPYGRRTSKFPRRCVFFGTTNNPEFLRDKTGDRRFWPVETHASTPTKSVFKDLKKEVDQIWAEAYCMYVLGIELELDCEEAKQIALDMQKKHAESSPKEGLIKRFLEKKVPLDWIKRDLSNRRLFLSSEFNSDGVDLVERDRVCALEIWCECFAGDPKYMKRSDSMEINSILENIPGWIRDKSQSRYGYCGAQRGFKRQILNNSPEMIL